MTKQSPDQLISEAVEAVLETMFFSAPLGPAELEIGGDVLETHVAFRGRLSGTLNVRLSETSARLLAGGFLGEDEESLMDAQLGQVVCELTNMLCGLLLSKLESEERFDLSSPEMVPARTKRVTGSEALPAARQSFELEGGTLTVALHLDAVA